jgi:hypothetical protein
MGRTSVPRSGQILLGGLDALVAHHRLHCAYIGILPILGTAQYVGGKGVAQRASSTRGVWREQDHDHHPNGYDQLAEAPDYDERCARDNFEVVYG